MRILLRLFVNYTIFLMLITVYFGYYWIPNKKYDKKMTKTSASDKNFRFFFSFFFSSIRLSYTKRHDKIFAMECTNTCQWIVVWTATIVIFVSLLKYWTWIKKTCWSQNYCWVMSEENRNLNVPKKALRKNVFCPFYDDSMF